MVTKTLANLGAVGCMSNYHTVTMTLANLGAVGCKSNYHTVTTTLANIGTVVCKSNYRAVTTLANLGAGRHDRMVVGLTTNSPYISRVVVTV